MDKFRRWRREERERESVCVCRLHMQRWTGRKREWYWKQREERTMSETGELLWWRAVCVCVCVHRVSPVARWWNLKRIIGPGSGTTLWAGGNAKDVSSRTDSTTTDERPVSTEVATFAASSPLTDRSADGNVDGSVSFTSSTNITDRISCFFGVLSSSFFLFDVHC